MYSLKNAEKSLCKLALNSDVQSSSARILNVRLFPLWTAF
jgi:hypothetical protein